MEASHDGIEGNVSNAIPGHRRDQVKQREMGRCLRCGGRGAEWHHRRSKSVHDAHTHCSCNGVWLCVSCHRWAHAHPFEARRFGFIVSRHQDKPGGVPVCARYGWVLMHCDGGFEYHLEGT